MELLWGKRGGRGGGGGKEILQEKQLPISFKKQVMDPCVLLRITSGCQIWFLNKQLTNKLRTAHGPKSNGEEFKTTR